MIHVHTHTHTHTQHTHIYSGLGEYSLDTRTSLENRYLGLIHEEPKAHGSGVMKI